MTSYTVINPDTLPTTTRLEFVGEKAKLSTAESSSSSESLRGGLKIHAICYDDDGNENSHGNINNFLNN